MVISEVTWWGWSLLVLAGLPFVMVVMNALLFGKAPKTNRANRDELPGISILIPARNEEAGIAHCVRSALASEGVTFEVIVLDDHSTDATASLVEAIAAEDDRVRLETAPALPEGWNGKQHACLALSGLAKFDRLLWIDADVQLDSDAVRRALLFQEKSKAPLVSGFPRQTTVTWLEHWVTPLIPVVLMAYLPMLFMRLSKSPGFGAGCGQMFLAQRDVYESLGGHEAVKTSMHDGVTLPRAFRVSGHMTDFFDASDCVSCRMYDSAPAVWNGFAKNATEGMAGTVAIWPWTILLIGGWVMPWLVLIGTLLGKLAGLWQVSQTMLSVLVIACAMSLCASLLVMFKCRQSWISGLCRPMGMLVLVAIQWYALTRKWRGGKATWRGRAYAAGD